MSAAFSPTNACPPSGEDRQEADDDPKKQIKPLKGLSIEGEGHRYYPGRELLGPVLGFVAPDGQGKDGLELALDEELRGRVEEVKGLRDRGGHLLFEGGQVDEQALFEVAEAGWSIVRTSAKTGAGVEEAFERLTRAMLSA
jgi:hypothetical protein